MSKRLGLPPDLYCRPLAYGLQNNPLFTLEFDSPAQNARKLRERNLSAAFLSPIDFGKESSEYHIVRGIAVSSREPLDVVSLHFRDKDRLISTIAIDPSFVSEIILAKIILAEEFDTTPVILPMLGTLEEMLRKADGALLVGDSARGAASRHLNRIDLVELWSDISGLPYVHGFWCAREGDLTNNDVVALEHSIRDGTAHFDQIADEATVHSGDPPAIANYLSSFSYDFTEEAEQGLREFLHYAYYHGVLPDVGETRFITSSSDTIDPLPPISPNYSKRTK